MYTGNYLFYKVLCMLVLIGAIKGWSSNSSHSFQEPERRNESLETWLKYSWIHLFSLSCFLAFIAVCNYSVHFLVLFFPFYLCIHFLLLFSCLHFPATTFPLPTHPHLPPSILPALALSLFLDDTSPSFLYYPRLPSPLVTINLFFISMSLVTFCLLVRFVGYMSGSKNYGTFTQWNST